MTKFEEIGQKFQMQAYDIDYAKWSFKNSCTFVVLEDYTLNAKIVLLLSLTR